MVLVRVFGRLLSYTNFCIDFFVLKTVDFVVRHSYYVWLSVQNTPTFYHKQISVLIHILKRVDISVSQCVILNNMTPCNPANPVTLYNMSSLHITTHTANLSDIPMTWHLEWTRSFTGRCKCGEIVWTTELNIFQWNLVCWFASVRRLSRDYIQASQTKC